jgi:hypothetical protein
MFERMQRAAKKDIAFYEEAERDTSLNGEALQVVLLVAGAAAIGVFLKNVTEGHIGAGIGEAIVKFGLTILSYYLWCWLVVAVGTKMFSGTSDMGEVRRTIAYSYSPNVAQVLVFIPGLGPLIAFIAGIWTLVLGIIAVRQAMDFSTGTAVATVVIAALLSLLVVAAIYAGLAIILIPLGLLSSMM